MSGPSGLSLSGPRKAAAAGLMTYAAKTLEWADDPTYGTISRTSTLLLAIAAEPGATWDDVQCLLDADLPELAFLNEHTAALVWRVYRTRADSTPAAA